MSYELWIMNSYIIAHCYELKIMVETRHALSVQCCIELIVETS